MTYDDELSNSTSDHAGRLQNGSRTCEPGDTGLPQRRSLSGRLRNEKKFEFVYFIRAGDTIKIGFSASPNARLKDLQTAHAERLELLGVIPGSIQSEARLHEQFKHLRKVGEWFRADPELLAYIDSVSEEARPAWRANPQIVDMVCRLTKTLRSSSPAKKCLIRNLIEQLRNFDRETDPTAKANLERFIGWSTTAIERTA